MYGSPPASESPIFWQVGALRAILPLAKTSYIPRRCVKAEKSTVDRRDKMCKNNFYYYLKQNMPIKLDLNTVVYRDDDGRIKLTDTRSPTLEYIKYELRKTREFGLEIENEGKKRSNGNVVDKNVLLGRRIIKRVSDVLSDLEQ